MRYRAIIFRYFFPFYRIMQKKDKSCLIFIMFFDSKKFVNIKFQVIIYLWEQLIQHILYQSSFSDEKGLKEASKIIPFFWRSSDFNVFYLNNKLFLEFGSILILSLLASFNYVCKMYQ